MTNEEQHPLPKQFQGHSKATGPETSPPAVQTGFNSNKKFFRRPRNTRARDSPHFARSLPHVLENAFATRTAAEMDRRSLEGEVHDWRTIS